MSRLEELIQELCPNGVEYKTIDELCYVLTGGEAPDDSIKEKEPDDTHIYPIYSNGIGENALWGYSSEYRVDVKSVTFSSIGTIGYPTLREPKFTPIIRLKVLYPKDDKVLNISFLKYALEIVEFKQQKSSLPNINANMIKEIKIPVPPMEVQCEIVHILDQFTLLTAELTAELTARKQQYQYYLDWLYENCGGEVRSLDEIGVFTRGKRFVHADAVEKDGVPCVHYGELYTYYGVYANKTKSQIRKSILEEKTLRYAKNGDVIIVGAGENDEDIGIGVAWEGNYDVAVHDACYTFVSNENPKFISFYLRSSSYHKQIKPFVSRGKICAISAQGIGKAKLKVPTLEEQQRIVSQLEQFDAYCNDLTQGLPAEIELRRKQYEYYRDKLLSFKELK